MANTVPTPARNHKSTHSAASPWAAPQPQPKLVAEWKRRQMPRYACALPGHLLNTTAGTAAAVQLLDISISGALVGGKELPEMGQTCELQTEWEGRQLSVPGAVTWKAKGQVGIRFSSLDEANEKLLKRICANSRLLPPAASTI